MSSTVEAVIDSLKAYIPSSQIFNEPLVSFTRDGLRRLSFEDALEPG